MYKRQPVDQGATFVHAVVREILLNAIDASKALGVDSKDRKQWQYVLNHLVPVSYTHLVEDNIVFRMTK